MKLGTLLLRNAAIGLSQLEGALRNQVLYGGRLGTNLVELGFIDLELLSTYLAELTGYPLASPAQLDNADLDLLDRLGSADAHRLRAIPLGDLGNSQTLSVAMVDPTDTRAISELAEKLGTKITPYVVPELRALYYLEKLFGQPRGARFIRSGSAPSEGEPEATDDRRRSQPAKGMVLPPAFTLEPRRRRSSSQLTLGSNVALAITYGAACERIDTATQREQIGEALVDYAKGRCDALILFLIRDGNALGWRGYVAPPARPRTQIEDLSLPLGGASSLQSAHDTGEMFLGEPPSAAKPVETQLWTALSVSPEPSTVLVLPVLVKHRAVNLIYVHSLAGRPAPVLITELTDLGQRIQSSYLRLIKQARGS